MRQLGLHIGDKLMLGHDPQPLTVVGTATLPAETSEHAMAREAGFAGVGHVPGSSLAERYFAGRADGLRPSSGEDFILATT